MKALELEKNTGRKIRNGKKRGGEDSRGTEGDAGRVAAGRRHGGGGAATTL